MPETDDRIVYCREIDPDTVLHLSSVGDRLVFRRFDGSDPFVAKAQTPEESRVCYNFPLDRPLSPEEVAHPATDVAWWREHFAKLNREVLGDLTR